MLSRASRRTVSTGVRAFSTSSPRQAKVAVVGAAGGIGQPLATLLKINDRVSQLNVYDLAPVTPGVAADLSHINSPAKVLGFQGAEKLAEALTGVDVIVCPAGVPRKPGMTRDDLFNINAGIVAGIAATAAKVAPKALHLIISNPVNSTVPIVAEVLKRAGAYDKRKVFGVTTLDVVRANTFVAENQKKDVRTVNVNVVGGHAGITILPLLSQVPGTKFTDADIAALTHRIMFGGDEVVKAKAGAGSATLSMAYAGAVFTDHVLRALKGEKGIRACTFVESNVQPGLQWFASPVELGKEGVEQIHGIGQISAFEKQKLEEMKAELSGSIAKGLEFARNFKL